MRSFLLLVVALPVACASSPSSPPPSSAATAPAAASALEARVARGGTTLLGGVTDRAEQKAVMKEISHELGVECDYCHDLADFTAPTANKKIANLMYARFVAGMAPRAGGVLDCAGCHHGQAKFLGDRADKQRIAALMQSDFVDKLQAKQGELRCETCHTDGKDKPFLPRG